MLGHAYSPSSWAGKDGAGIDELRGEAIRMVVIALMVLAWGIFAVMAAVIHRADAPGYDLIASVVLTAALTYKALRISTRLAAFTLTISLMLTVVVTLLLDPGGVTAPLFALVALLAVSLLGWAWGILAAALGTILVLNLVVPAGTDPTASGTAVFGVFMIWTATALSWILSRPLQSAVEWSWSSYLESLKKTEELRDRQAQLVQLSSSLNVALDQLEQLTTELDRARRAAERAREMKTQFAVAISHELRTPLNLIIGFTEMMVLSPEASYSEKLPESYRGDLETIYCNACHISNLIDDVLDLSQVEAHRLALQKDWATLATVIQEATSVVGTMIKDKHLDLQVNVPAELPPLLIDQVRVRQVLINLLVNAARFTERGGITISVTMSADEAIVSVQDTGVGMAPEDLPRVFEDFWQVRRLGFNRGGSGVGLAVSRRLIELHGGSMWAESRPGEGSTFFFSLPYGKVTIPGTLEADWKSRAAAVIRSGLMPALLVVDASGERARIFQRYFDGYQVFAAASFEQANALAQQAPMHAVILDSPEAERSWLALERPKSLGSALVIVCPLQTSRDRVDELGVVDFLVKPFARDRLRNALRKVGKKLPRRLLVVDDDTEMVRLVSRSVKSFATTCQVWSALDGDQALQILHEHHVEVVLIDLVMPGMDGYALLAAMRQSPMLRDVPVIVMTGWEAPDKTVMTQSLTITNPDGLTVGQTMRCLKRALDSLLPPSAGNGPAQPASFDGSPVLAESR